MVLLDKLWDDVLAGPHPERGLGKLRKIAPKPLNTKGGGSFNFVFFLTTVSFWSEEGEGSGKYQKSVSMPASPGTPATPTTPSPTSARKENVWRSVFHPGSNIATKRIGGDMFDKPLPNSPTVYDWYVDVF
ncbi:hypothetical protein RJ639_005718 [Escallonia herrerae]|uniref:Auxin-repressed protein n=1 Tax=Escallonia herrerae TaxID=1293975 RepID=A0AA88VUS9_9ASTE|nr:hypothetical protein RJ639_005718 [Escallonia herrerae]